MWLILCFKVLCRYRNVWNIDLKFKPAYLGESCMAQVMGMYLYIIKNNSSRFLMKMCFYLVSECIIYFEIGQKELIVDFHGSNNHATAN